MTRRSGRRRGTLRLLRRWVLRLFRGRLFQLQNTGIEWNSFLSSNIVCRWGKNQYRHYNKNTHETNEYDSFFLLSDAPATICHKFKPDQSNTFSSYLLHLPDKHMLISTAISRIEKKSMICRHDEEKNPWFLHWFDSTIFFTKITFSDQLSRAIQQRLTKPCLINQYCINLAELDVYFCGLHWFLYFFANSSFGWQVK